eukprot:gene27254-2237_t
MLSLEDSHGSEDGNKETTTLYFGNLHPQVEQASLEDLCRYFGENQAKLIKDRPSGTSAGFGFVKFQEKNAAEKALLALNGNCHLGHELRVNWALPNTYNDYNMHQLFVGDLPADITDAQLYNAFCTSGQCSDVRIMWDHVTGRSKGYGFVSFHIKEDADNALVKMHGSLIGGRKIRCGWAQHKQDDCSATPDHDSIDRADPSNTNVYVGNIPPEWIEHELTNHFSVYGYIAEVKLHKKGGYGFVKFCAHESAVKAIFDLQGKDCQGRAIVDLQGKDCQGRVLKCSWGKNISLLMPLRPHTGLSDANTRQLPVLGGLERVPLSSHGHLSPSQRHLSPLSSMNARHPNLARDSSMAALHPNSAHGSLDSVHPNLARDNSMTAMHPNLARDSLDAFNANLLRGLDPDTLNMLLAAGGLPQLNIGGLPSTESSYMGTQPTHQYNQNQSQMLAQQNADLSLALQIMVQGMDDPGSKTPSPPPRMMMQGMHGMSTLDPETNSPSPQKALHGMTAIGTQPYAPPALSEQWGDGSARPSELWYPDSILNPAAPHAAQARSSAQQPPMQTRIAPPQPSSTQTRPSAQQLPMLPRLVPQPSNTQTRPSAQHLPLQPRLSPQHGNTHTRPSAQQLLASMGGRGGMDMYMGGEVGLDFSLGGNYPKAYPTDLAQQMQGLRAEGLGACGMYMDNRTTVQAMQGVRAEGLGACGMYMYNRNSNNRMLSSQYR